MNQTIKNGLPALLDCDENPFPSVVVICHNCQGKGTHVNRAIDENGISPEEFAEDPDFEEAYFSGVYDVPCDLCKGFKLIAEPVREGLTKDQEQLLKEDDEYQNELAQEAHYRRMGIEW